MSNRQAAAVNKLLSSQTAEKLNKALEKDNMEQLKKHMEKLFTYKNIFNMHDDHLTELAQFIADLSKEKDRLTYIRENEGYIRRRMEKCKKAKDDIVKKNQWAGASKMAGREKMLDLSYQAWVYEEGYQHSKLQMLGMMCNIMQAVEECEKAGRR